VDGVAEVEIRGTNATLRNIAGGPPEWRRFQCSAPMPPNPQNFRFAGVDGRGRQQLVRDPRDGAAVVRIEDPDNGSEGYTFDITWGGGVGGGGGNRGPDGRDRQGPAGGIFGGIVKRFTTDQAIQVCQDAVRQQVGDRFRSSDVRFRRINLDDTPGRNDWVVGIIDVGFGDRRVEPYRFSCSVNFDNGQVRSAEIERLDESRGPGPGESPGNRAMDSCRRSVEDRLHRDGYDRVDVRSINVDDKPGRNDWVIGSVEAGDATGGPTPSASRAP